MSNQLAVVRNFVEQYFTVVRFGNGTVMLLPRREIEVECETYDEAYDLVGFRVAFAPNAAVYIEASPIADFKQCLQYENFESMAKGNNFNAKLTRRGDYVDLTVEDDTEGRYVTWRTGECTIELTADAWATLRQQMLEVLEKVD